MVDIGVEKRFALVYEGSGGFGYIVRPSPMITAAKFVDQFDSNLQGQPSSDPFGYRFREDSYDPVTRIRRGRFYQNSDQQPIEWWVSNNFGYVSVDNPKKELETFHSCSVWHQFIKNTQKFPLVLLGVDDRFTIHSIIDVEAISTGEELVTLKARNRFGVLPELVHDAIPEYHLARLTETLDRLADEVGKSSPISVIDRARDVATILLLAYFDFKEADAKDLGKLLPMLEQKNLQIAACSGKIISRLHARAKPSEQESRKLPHIREHDALLAVQCVGTLLCEVGYAEWR